MQRASESGFSLLELAVASSVFLITLTGVTALMVQSVERTAWTRERNTAFVDMRAVVDYVRSLPADRIADALHAAAARDAASRSQAAEVDARLYGTRKPQGEAHLANQRITVYALDDQGRRQPLALPSLDDPAGTAARSGAATNDPRAAPERLTFVVTCTWTGHDGATYEESMRCIRLR